MTVSSKGFRADRGGTGNTGACPSLRVARAAPADDVNPAAGLGNPPQLGPQTRPCCQRCIEWLQPRRGAPL